MECDQSPLPGYPLHTRFFTVDGHQNTTNLPSGFGFAIYLCAGLIPWIGIVDVIYEHRLYLPSIGFFMALVSGIILIKERLAIRAPVVERALIPVMILVVIALSVTAHARNMVWRDEVTLWENVLKKSPYKSRSHNNLGVLYQTQGRLDEACHLWGQT